MLEQAARLYGPARAEDLRKQIEETAESLSALSRFGLELDGEEPDFLVSPAVAPEVE